MAANQIACFWLEQSSVLKFLVVEKCKPCEIYRRICDVYEEASLSLKDVYEWGKGGFSTTKWQSIEWKGIYSPRKMSPNEMVSKDLTDSLLEYKRIYQCWFPWKKSLSYSQLLKQNSPYLLNNYHVHTKRYLENQWLTRGTPSSPSCHTYPAPMIDNWRWASRFSL